MTMPGLPFAVRALSLAALVIVVLIVVAAPVLAAQPDVYPFRW
jgi:hypothetical protein